MMDKDIPYIVYESEAARHERTVRRLVLALVVAIALIFISNVAWLWFFNQFDYETDTITQDTDAGDNSYIGNDGAIVNGTTDSNGN